jgi:quinol monooxygenase YgiN
MSPLPAVTAPKQHQAMPRLQIRATGRQTDIIGTRIEKDDQMSAQAKTIAILTAKPSKQDELRALLLGMVADCRAEPGNLRWDIWHDPAEPGRFVLDELYRDVDAVAAHRATPHFKNYAAKVQELAERVAVTVEPTDVA